MAEDLREALASALHQVPAERLTESVWRLIGAYRSGEHADRPLLRSGVDATAYAAYRMPATHAAVRAALDQVRGVDPGIAPRSLLDVGGGTGAALWAAAGAFPTLDRATVLDQVPEALALGERLAADALYPVVRTAAWRPWHASPDGPLPDAELVLVSYVLGELHPQRRDDVVRQAADATGALLVIVEPGTPAGHRRVLRARALLVERGLTVVGPCPHQQSCPLFERDWCHFAARVNRSALHRRLKDGQLGHEDEKFSYVAATTAPTPSAAGRIVRHPAFRKGLVTLRVCDPDGAVTPRLVSKRQGELYRQARAAAWGDSWPPPPDTGPPG